MRECEDSPTETRARSKASASVFPVWSIRERAARSLSLTLSGVILPSRTPSAAATGLAVTIDNDANAVALAELWFGRPEVSDARDFILVLVAEGVGTGIIFDGQVYRGERGAAGEFGHMIVGADAPVPCSCGSYDCWEAFASERAALARYLGLCSESIEPAAGFPHISRPCSRR